MLSGRLFALLCLLQLQKVFLFGFLKIFNQKDGRLEVWDIAKQNMDPIFRLDIDQSEQKNHLLPLETIEESEENSLGHLKKNVKSGKQVNKINKLKKKMKHRRKPSEQNHFTSLLFSSKHPVLLAGDTNGKVQVFRVWGYEHFFDRDCDQENILMRGKNLIFSFVSVLIQKLIDLIII